ncbi:hypothetical protein ACI2IY_02570 [Lysobacter enzymogenes]|uniref:hypothetical protein n=1 Tax=Lysobacter enzymogenes TaxID=69 RepID=UPI0038516106
MNPDWIGWLASAVLIATLLRQIVKQARTPDPQGVSRWLFLGQCAASAGFVVYSLLLHNWVFVVTNSCTLATALAGQALAARRRREA